MGDILVFLQLHEGSLLKASLSAVSAAQELKQRWNCGRLVGLLLGPRSKEAAANAARYGFDELRWCESSELAHYLAAPYASTVSAVLKGGEFDVFVAAATSIGKDLTPRIAALWDAGQASDIIAVNPDGSLKRPMYAGDILADVEITSAKKAVTVRPTAFAPAVEGKSGSVTEAPYTAAAFAAGSFIEYKGSGGDRPELGDAAIVVSGGRALQSAENFEKYIFPLADVLGAAVGASRAAVDSGYAPNDWQVGQTGKVVAPQLYIAAGISGAIQHLAGMKDSKVIVAINKDAEAPIFEIADYGLVADLFEALPKLTAEIKRIKGQ
ncbi:MAG: electron transfer flavoprotein subunit alpha/FixB family protein [Bdellovibrionota bacterium]|nr:MAG: electron transfer flavoprotein subunit alpha/FixB family protein [Bdellovibrionota bacterium]